MTTKATAANSDAGRNWPIAFKPAGNGPAPIRLLLVDDDQDFRAAACMELEDLGFEPVCMPSGDAMFDWLKSGNRVDVIVLDWQLPGSVGVEFLRPLREHNITTPVIFFTGKPATIHERVALDSGAIDFVDKARGLPILARRIRRIVESLPPAPGGDAEICCGPLSLFPDQNRSQWRGQDVGLTVTEYNIVEFMIANRGQHVTYRAIYDCVRHAGFIAGSGQEGYRTNVRSTVKRIRHKFRALDPDFAEIENFAAFGYRWRQPEF